jgi:hypothetical protein
MSGDIRKAFQICRGAAELLRQRCQEAGPEAKLSQPKVRISDVQKASRESFDSALVTAVSFSTPFQALLLVSLASLCRTTGREVGGFDMTDILTKMEALSGASGNPLYAPPPTMGETIQLLNRLAEVRCIFSIFEEFPPDCRTTHQMTSHISSVAHNIVWLTEQFNQIADSK